jgi:xanthine/CO dehydrogenase XdhC/CoxF family maturation factor
VWQAARDALKSGLPKIVDYDLTGRTDTPEGLICGGMMKVFVDVAGTHPSFNAFAEIERIKGEGKALVLATLVSDQNRTAWNETPRFVVEQNARYSGRRLS